MKRSLLMSWLACVLLAGVVNLASAYDAAPMDAAQRRAAVDRLMDRYTGEVPGVSLLVVKDGKALVRRGYGFADLETRARATPATNYRLASVSKQFTAASILLLKQDGKLKLSDPVRKWLPQLPASDDAITIRHLLTHTSGLIDYEDLIPDDRQKQLSDADVFDLIVSQHRLYFAPGSDYRYSNGGYVLLGLIVERVSGEDLAAFMHQRIFKPLGMDHTLMYEHRDDQHIAHRAWGYSFLDGRWKRTDQSLTSATRGDGGIYSSIDDLAKWDAAWYDNRLLDADSRRAAMRVHTPTDDPDVGYGYGWRITGDSLWHSGESQGFRNVIVRWPKRHLTVIILTNRNDPKPYPLALAVGELFGAFATDRRH